MSSDFSIFITNVIIIFSNSLSSFQREFLIHCLHDDSIQSELYNILYDVICFDKKLNQDCNFITIFCSSLSVWQREFLFHCLDGASIQSELFSILSA